MPRASGSAKRQLNAVSNRDTRHDNGLVGPAKRVANKKSQAQLDGSARPAVDHGPGFAGPSSPTQPTANGHGSKAGTVGDSRASDALRRGSLGGVSEASSDSGNFNVGGNATVDGGHRQIDVNALKNSDVHKDSGPLDLAATVLRSLPLQDTLAILIILMHVPSASLTVVYVLFTCLTFVPPVTTSSGMNINFAELFDGISTMPSLVTVACMDLLFLLIWLFLWQPIQDALVDFAKPVIAITLGGGVSAKDGTSRGFTACFTWVVVHHLLRGTRAHWSKLARHIPEEWHVPAIFTESLEPQPDTYDRISLHGFLRSCLAIHILTQGVVRYVREWYLKREKASAASTTNDPEAGKAPGTAESMVEAGLASVDADGSSHQNIGQASTKKKRKQSAQVRLQQPLWSALASTKIVVMKEYELKHATSESAGTNATDIHNLGNAPFDTQPGQIWISYIGSDEVCFSTSFFPDQCCDQDTAIKTNGSSSRPAGVDMAKPFYVRINKAFWQLTRMYAVDDANDEQPQEGCRWTGDVYGLRPASKYVCEFVDSRTDKILFTSSIRTVHEPLRETERGSQGLPNGQLSLQPDSPITTLKTSIAAAEAKLNDEKGRLKTLRKEWKTRFNSLKKDSELTDNQLCSAGNHDEKYRQKIRQQETQKAQAERDIEDLTDQLKNFDTAPELADRKKVVERAYSAEKKLFDAAQKQFKDHRTGLEKEVNAKKLEQTNLQTKRNKIATRIAKVDSELANITDANNRGIDEAERRRQERAQWQEQVSNIENNYLERLAGVRSANAVRSDHIKTAQAQLHGFHDFMNSANGMPVDLNIAGDAGTTSFPSSGNWSLNPAAPPHLPGSMWSGSSTDLSMPMSNAPGMPGMPAWVPPPTAAPFQPQGFKSRGRSSSMLSDISGFTQSTTDEADSPSGSQHQPRSRQVGSADSGSTGESSGTGSTGEPTSPR